VGDPILPSNENGDYENAIIKLNQTVLFTVQTIRLVKKGHTLYL